MPAVIEGEEPLQCIPLSPLDNAMAHCYAKYLLCFSIVSHQNHQHVHSILQQALSMTVAQLPIYKGIVGFRPQTAKNWKPGQLEVRVPKHAGKGTRFPVIFNDLSEQIDFDELRDQGFPQEDLGGKELLSGAFNRNLEGGLDVVVAQSNFVEGGCLLGLGVWHSVSDAYGAYTLLETWSKNCQQLQSPETMDLFWRPLTESLDRGVLTRAFMSDGVEPLTVEGGDAELWKFLGLEPRKNDSDGPKGQGTSKHVPLSASQRPPKRTCVFYISGTSLANIRQIAHSGKSDESPKISASDAVCAFLWRTIMRARHPQANEQPEQVTSLDVLLDGRQSFSSALPTTYLGNVVFFATTSLPLALVTSQSNALSTIAAAVRSSLSENRRGIMHGAFALANSCLDYTKLSYSFAGLDEPKMSITSTLNIPIFDLNFGPIFANGGHAESIRTSLDDLDNAFRRCLVMPMRTHGGFEVIVVGMFEDEFERLMKDPEFNEYAEFSCF